MMPPVLDWAAAADAGPTEAGGKGWQLACLDRFGVPVPQGFVLGASASAGRRPGEPVGAEVVAALTQALHRRGWDGLPLVVRSSAPMEDSARASFAGIHLTRVNVRGIAAIIEAVRAVWDSPWTPQARAYRERHGMADREVTMAIVVMPMLPAEAAGIAFTCDPVTGRDDQLLIHAHWGLGEALVGGQAEGDEYRLQASHLDDRLALVAQRIGAKASYTEASAGGGTALVATPPARARQAVLMPEQAIALGQLACDAARALDYTGHGYDIEWVWDGERFWIVQARPVTVQGRHTYAALRGQPDYWTRGNTREILPEPLSPLDWELSRTMANRMLSRGYELSGFRTLPGVQRAALFQGRLYLQASLMQWEGYDSLGIAPQVMNRLLGGEQGEIAVPPPTMAERAARAWRTLRYLRRSASVRRHADAALRDARARAAGWRAQSPPADVARLGRNLRERFALVRGADDLFFLQGSGGGTLFNLVQLIERYCPGEGHALTAALMAGGEASVTAAQGYALMALGNVAAQDKQALAWLRSADRVGAHWERALAPDSPFRAAFAEFVQRYGHRGLYESYLRKPRWREAPDYLLDSVLHLMGSDTQALQRRQQQGADRAWRRLRQAMPFWSLPLVRKLIAGSRVELNQREAARSALTAYIEVLRRDALALGQALAGPHGLASADDIFALTTTEALAVAEGRLDVGAAARRAARRREQLDAWAAQTEPAVVVVHGNASHAAPLRGDKPPARARDAADVWHGTPVGSGSAAGAAHLARSPADGLGMAAGDVLVAPSTDPAWTPLFLKAGALVLETGGYLSHGAIVAREFGIPAVVNLPGIVDRLREGDRLEVDGERGVVRRIAAHAHARAQRSMQGAGGAD